MKLSSCIILLSVPAFLEAAVLTFSNSIGLNLQTSAQFDAYGDNITATSQDGFDYGAAEGFTPNVVVDYNGVAGWPDNYGDLVNVVWNSLGTIEVTFTAEPGVEVRLHSFDLGGWNRTDYTIAGVSVTDQSDGVLFSDTNVAVEGADDGGPERTSIVFATPLQGESLTLTIDKAGAPLSNVGLDNVTFSQVGTPIPEPAALGGLFSLAALLIARRRA